MLHKNNKTELAEDIQNLIVRIVATSPAGRNLQLIGGYRYRLLNRSPRRSNDIDYNWDSDLEAKRNELLTLFRRKLLPDVKRTTGHEGSVGNADGPEDDTNMVKGIELAFYNAAIPDSRIVIPVEITRISRSDPPLAVAAESTIILTVSDQDMVESKVIALLNRTFVTARDFIDVFLFRTHVRDNSQKRLEEKLFSQGITGESVRSRLDALQKNRVAHVKSVAEAVNAQMDEEARLTLAAGGGAETIYESVMGILQTLTENFIRRVR